MQPQEKGLRRKEMRKARRAKERDFRETLVGDLRQMFHGSLILRADPNDHQGIPDVLVLWQDRWAALECKASENEAASPGPNQKHYINKMNEMSFADFIHPGNKEAVLDALQRAFKSQGPARFSRAK